jgi:hypothetical protein
LHCFDNIFWHRNHAAGTPIEQNRFLSATASLTSSTLSMLISTDKKALTRSTIRQRHDMGRDTEKSGEKTGMNAETSALFDRCSHNTRGRAIGHHDNVGIFAIICLISHFIFLHLSVF